MTFFPIILTLAMLFLFLSALLFWGNMWIQIFFLIFSFNSVNMSMGLLIDWMSMLFSSSVLMISSMIAIFSFSYINPKDHSRFYLVLLSFVTSMILMVTSNNIFFVMLGWDGLGLSSYILVIYYMDMKSKESGAITILSNRIGDIFLIFAIGLSLMNGLMDFSFTKEFPFLLIIFLIIASLTKSAQFPFMAWLPAAMAAPTPISALVHSSTLVTAGVFLLIRLMSNPHPYSMFILLFISSATMFISGISANWEQDFKKIIALSTLSQMAMIMFAISISVPVMAFFHLITHAFFKSTMFLCAGAMIHNSSYQDIRSQGTNTFWSPTVISSFNITSMSLMGLPFLSGFYSKDAMMEFLFSNHLNFFIFAPMLISIGLTAVYSSRLISSSSKFINKSSPEKSFHPDIYITTPIITLIPLSIFMGSSLSWLILPSQSTLLPLSMKLLIPLFITMGISLGLLLSYNNFIYFKQGKFFSSLWFLNFISSLPTTKTLLSGQKLIYLDKSWMEWASAMGSFFMISSFSKLPDKLTLSLLCCLIFLIFLPQSYLLFLISLNKALYWS